MRHDVLTRSARLTAMALVVGLAGLAVSAQEASDAAFPQAMGLPQAACAGLQGFTIPASAIGLPSRAQWSNRPLWWQRRLRATQRRLLQGHGHREARNPTSPNLEFEVNLPLAWNRRVLQMGGGGYDGTLVTGLRGSRSSRRPSTTR